MQNPKTEIPTGVIPETVSTKKRHGCLTACLILMIVASAIAIIVYLAGSSSTGSFVNVPGWASAVFIIMGVFEIVCVIALFMWKKWGFWGFGAITVINFIINISIGMGAYSLMGLIGIAVLYGVLNIGKENKGWPQLD